MSHLRDRDKDTIAAIATAQGVAGIAVIRISGVNAVSIARIFCPFVPEKPESHRVYYGYFMSLEGEPVDEILLTYFQHGRSFTGEETIEISLHGNPLLARKVLQCLVAKGARAADRGEFTYRAFMNGRIDLVQAESILALIESQTDLGAKQALQQLTGSLSRQLKTIEDSLTWCVANLEAGIDFSTEGLDLAELDEVHTKLTTARLIVESLLGSYKKGRLLKEGFSIALVGLPNVGKSSLLNLLLGESKAIVTPVPGTTRDVVEGSLLVNGVRVSLKDTAGIRETTDLVESIGISKSRDVINKADLVLLVLDSTVGLNAETLAMIREIPQGKDLIYVLNKSDLSSSSTLGHLTKELQDSFGAVAVISGSCLSGDLLPKIVKCLEQRIEIGEIFEGGAVFQARHYELLNRCFSHLDEAIKVNFDRLSPEIAAFEIKEALLNLYEIQGKVFDDQIMDKVFKEFCIGK